MRASAYLTLTFAAIFCLGAILPLGILAAGQPLSAPTPSDQQAATADFSSGASGSHEPLRDASELSSNGADLPMADRRDSEAGRVLFSRLSHLPRAVCDAAVDPASSLSGWRLPASGRLPDDDRPHFSQTLVIEHVRLQI